MARQIKRRISSLSFFMQKAYWKIMTAKPSIFVIATIVIAGSIFLLGGGIYDLLEMPIPAYFTGTKFIVIHPYLNEQFLVESIIVMITYAIGVVGFLLTYQSTKYAYRPRQAFILLLVGFVLIIIAYFMNENFLLARWRQ